MSRARSVNTQVIGRVCGFTMIELMIVVVIMALLLSIAIPAYQGYVLRANRAEGKNFLLRVQAAQERLYTNNSVYSANMVGAGSAGLGFASATAPNNKFTVGIALTNANRGYVLTLTPANGHADPDCTTLTVDNLGNKAATGAAQETCWTR